jgi:hypothetical protein
VNWTFTRCAVVVARQARVRHEESDKMLRTWLALSIFFAFLGGHALAQSLIPARSISAKANELFGRHIGPRGKPCLALESYAKSQVVNKDIYEHWIRATNSCGQTIKLRVCYRKSEDCIVMNVPPWDSKNSVLGIYPMQKEFQYDAQEQF